MTKASPAQAGRKGGLTTAQKYGREYMQEIGRRGARRLHELYKRVPVGINDFVLVRRDNNEVNHKTLNGKEIGENETR